MPEAAWTAESVGWTAWLLGWTVPCFLIALLGTWLARRYALRRRLLDLPGERRSHDVATPRGGGIAIVIAFVAALAFSIMQAPRHAFLLLCWMVGTLLVAGIGWVDDHRSLPAWPRLLVQAIAALLLAWGIGHDSGSALAAVVAFGAAMVLVNVWNFMDGIDGLAASQALLAALGYGVLAATHPMAFPAFALAAACLGFLPFNLRRARIFLGDVGSGALGYALAGLGVWLATTDWRHAPALLLPLSAFLIDASLTLGWRMLRGHQWWRPHTEHAYQHWARNLRGHGAVTAAYALWTLAAVLVMLAARHAGTAFMMTALISTCLGGGAVWTGLRRPR